ncbi:PAS domain-containing protein [Brevundimonas sp.]|uniref:PAS domain-containing protein n=1 Tax=Brevundimonas sp. TaxID=1871086 RepID=UPI00286B9590|nr:PAS domain-containing protein [Brevundimonas sp.]
MLENISSDRPARALIASHLWETTPLGARDGWPLPVQTLVDVMLGSTQAMFVVWGAQRTLIYNDAYAAILANKHPSAMGRDFLEVWGEVRAGLQPIVDEAYAGSPVAMDDIALTMTRRGYEEDAHFAFSYTPVRDERGVVGGFFCACVETTEQVVSGQKLKEAEARFRAVQETSIDGFMVLESVRDETDTIVDFRWAYANAAAEAIVGKPRAWFIGRRLLEEMPGNREEGLFDAYVRVVDDDKPWVTELSYAHEGVDVFLRLTAAKVGDGFAVSFADLTERRRYEVRLAEAATAIENMAEGFLILDPQFRIRQINAEAARMDGRRPEEIVGLHLLEAWPEARDAPTLAAYERALRDQVPVELVYQHHSETHDLWLEVRAYPTIHGLAVLYRDVTERFNAERRLQEASERVQLALDAGAIVGTWVWDIPTDRITGDERFAGVFGLDPETSRNGISFNEVTKVVHPDDMPVLSDTIAEAFERGGAYRSQYRVRHGVGYRWLEASGQVELAADGSPMRFPGVLIDIDERRAVEAERDRALVLLEGFTAAVPGVVYAKDRDGRMLVANHGTTELIGKAPSFYLGKTDLEFLEDEDQARAVMANDQKIMADGSPTQVEEVVTGPDGAPIVWLSTKAPLRNEAGEIVGVIGSSIDITARKNAESALEASQSDLKALNETLEIRVLEAIAAREQMQEALKQSQKLESMGQLTGGVAHDFNNLLTPILGSLDMLHRRELGNDRERRLIEGALHSAERAKVLVQRLLSFARRQPLQPVAVDLKTLVEGMVDLVESTCGPRIHLSVDVPADLPMVNADPHQLEMAILNISVNARDAMSDGGTITIRCMSDVTDEAGVSDPFVRLSIQDTGTGMDAATLARAIEPFFSTKGVGQGTGLGLSMAHGLAAQLGGRLSVESELGRGTTATFHLPIASHAEGRVERTDPMVKHSLTGIALLIDDEQAVRDSTANMLFELGYEVVEAGSAEEALERLDAGLRPSIILSDHLMPGMSGTEFARQVAAREGMGPVLLVSGYSEEAGIDPELPRLVKPFKQFELAAALVALTGSP